MSSRALRAEENENFTGSGRRVLWLYGGSTCGYGIEIPDGFGGEVDPEARRIDSDLPPSVSSLPTPRDLIFTLPLSYPRLEMDALFTIAAPIPAENADSTTALVDFDTGTGPNDGGCIVA
ncbi:hypothetical protein BKA93DRAFT_826695 [Sparassis latifolia]